MRVFSAGMLQRLGSDISELGDAHDRVIRIFPLLVSKREEVDWVMEKLEAVLWRS